MAYTTGNPERDALLLDAIRRVIAVGKTPVLKFVARLLPNDFSADQEELDGMLADMQDQDKPPEPPPQVERVAPRALMITETPDGHPLGELPQVAEDEPPQVEAADDTVETTLTERQARAVFDQAHKRLDRAQAAMAIAQETLKQLRGGLAAEIASWQLLFKPQVQTREQLQRETIAANQAYKQAVKDGTVAPPVRGPSGRGRSYIDRASGRGGDGSDFARRYQGTSSSLGGAKVYKGARRDGLPSQYQNQRTTPPGVKA
jgi:hypothetical protein